MKRTKQPGTATYVFLIALVLYTLLVAAYVGLRFGWTWSDADAIRLSKYSQALYNEGRLQPPGGSYPPGWAFPTLTAFLGHVTGLQIGTLQVYVQPFLIALLVPGAYVAFRRLTGKRSAALLASLLLFLQPEFLFESLRSSHAKITWLLALTMLFILARSFQERRGGWALARWVLLFYIIAFGLIASNSFFASGYLFGIAFSFVGGGIVVRWRGGHWSSSHLARLGYVVLSCAVLFFLSFFYLYQPSLFLLRELKGAVDQASALLLGTGLVTNPYGFVQSAWREPWLYPILTLLNWLILGLSFFSWLLKGRTLLLRRGNLHPGALLLWLLYTAFALLLALSLLLDLASVLSANLQVRLFPHLMIVAIPMACDLLAQPLPLVFRQSRLRSTILVTLMAAIVLFLSAASLLKSTTDPLLNSRAWFSIRQEWNALRWVEEHLYAAEIWIGYSKRLTAISSEQDSWKQHGLLAVSGDPEAGTRFFLISEPIRVEAAQESLLLPNTYPQLQVYDNRAVTLYHTRPQTPYQR